VTNAVSVGAKDGGRAELELKEKSVPDFRCKGRILYWAFINTRFLN
jgi:hypothetical protein